MMIFLALLALASADCGRIQNPSFNPSDSVAPWVSNSFNGGADWCPGRNLGSDQCELIQQNIAESGQSLDNRGRIAVGRRNCQCIRPNRVGNGPCNERCAAVGEGSAGRNVYQDNVKLCPDMRYKVLVARQDRRRQANRARFDMRFALLVGPDADSFLGGRRYEIANVTLPPPSAAPWNQLIESELEGVFPGPECGGQGCGCQTIGVRIERDATINENVFSFVDDFQLIDETDPVLSASDVTVRAESCGASASVDLSSRVSASDNCCDAPAITCRRTIDDSVDDWDCSERSFPAGCTDVIVFAEDNAGTASDAPANNKVNKTIQVCVANPMPTISCPDLQYDSDACVTNIPETADEVTYTNCGDANPEYRTKTTSWTEDRATLDFWVGRGCYHSRIASDDGLGGTDYAECKGRVVSNLCCGYALSVQSDGRRSAKPTLRSMAKK